MKEQIVLGLSAGFGATLGVTVSFFIIYFLCEKIERWRR